MTAVIRIAGAGDIDVLAELLSEVQALHVVNRPETFRELTADEIGAAFNQSAHEAFRKLGFVPKVVRFEFKSPA
jgi:hypothetical protein